MTKDFIYMHCGLLLNQNPSDWWKFLLICKIGNETNIQRMAFTHKSKCFVRTKQNRRRRTEKTYAKFTKNPCGAQKRRRWLWNTRVAPYNRHSSIVSLLCMDFEWNVNKQFKWCLSRPWISYIIINIGIAGVSAQHCASSQCQTVK